MFRWIRVLLEDRTVAYDKEGGYFITPVIVLTNKKWKYRVVNAYGDPTSSIHYRAERPFNSYSWTHPMARD